MSKERLAHALVAGATTGVLIFTRPSPEASADPVPLQPTSTPAAAVGPTPTPNCAIETTILAQYFRPAQGETLYKPGDQIIGPASGRKFLLESINLPPQMATTDREGKLVAKFQGPSNATYTNDKGERFPAISIQETDLQNGDKATVTVPCDLAVDRDIHVNPGPLILTLTPVPSTPIPVGTPIEVTPGRFNTPTPTPSRAVTPESTVAGGMSTTTSESSTSVKSVTSTIESTSSFTSSQSRTQAISTTTPETSTATAVATKAETSAAVSTTSTTGGNPPGGPDSINGLLKEIHDTPIPTVGWFGDRMSDVGSVGHAIVYNPVAAALFAVGVIGVAVLEQKRLGTVIVYNELRLPDRVARRFGQWIIEKRTGAAPFPPVNAWPNTFTWR